MKAYEIQLHLPAIEGNVNLLEYFAAQVSEHFPPHTHPVRFVVTQSDQAVYYTELGVLELDAKVPTPAPDSIFRFERRPVENTREFNAVLLVNTFAKICELGRASVVELS